MKRLLLILLILLSFCSCDYYYSYDLSITNATESDLQVKAYRLNEDNELETFFDKLIPPNSSLQFDILQRGGNCSKDCPVNPLNQDYFTEDWSLDSLVVIKDNIGISEYVNTISNWEFRSEPQVGIYEITLFNSDFE
ncbi:hypothetical protein [uncultured Winogradskyella sp.]|uniref:hypothetical protein n=1 Tax=uncultured Winogradskyella sp. TaxID=395353 RepID=UPI002637B1F7|nr:hypothetical protein [uncultured Winogradskyella sp.]